MCLAGHVPRLENNIGARLEPLFCHARGSKDKWPGDSLPHITIGITGTEHDKYMSAFVECSKLDVLILTMIKVPILYI